MMSFKNLSKKKIKYGAFSLVITAIFIVAIIFFNIIVSLLTESFFLKIDLTETGLYSLSPQAERMLENMTESVDIVILSEESRWLTNNYLVVLTDILKNYAAISGGKIRVQYVNPTLNYFNNPNYNNSLADLKSRHTELEDMSQDDIILISERRVIKIRVSSLFVMGQQGGVTAVKVDQELINSLNFVLNEDIPGVVFLEGHGENQADYLRDLLERSGYTSSFINLATQEIPTGTVLVLSVGPKVDFFNEEIVKLENFLSARSNFMLFYDFATPSLPNLDEFLEIWGVKVENKLIFDEQFTFLSIPELIGGQIIPGILPSLEKATDNPVGIYRARPLSETGWSGQTRGRFSRFPLLQTYSTSSYAKDLSGEITSIERTISDGSGPFVLAYHVMQTLGEDRANLFVFGSADMVDDGFLNMYGQNFYNVPLLAVIASDINPYGQNIFIAATQLADTTMLISSSGVRTVLVLLVIMMPLCIMISGIIVWRKRRNK